MAKSDKWNDVDLPEGIRAKTKATKKGYIPNPDQVGYTVKLNKHTLGRKLWIIAWGEGKRKSEVIKEVVENYLNNYDEKKIADFIVKAAQDELSK